jgi:hypothetical protein
MMPVLASGSGGAGTVFNLDVLQLMPLEVVLLFSVIFIIVGFLRGVRAEAWTTAFIVLAFIVLGLFGDALVAWANRFYKLTRFALAGGIVAENPVEIWQQFADSPPLIETDFERMVFRIAVFLTLYLIGLFVARAAVSRSLAPIGFGLIRRLPDLGERVMGALLGAVNGFLVALFVLPQVLPATRRTVIVVPQTTAVSDFLQENLINVAFIIVVIAIVLGLMASGGLRQRG